MTELTYQPLVSIIIPVYKGYPFMAEAIDSALNQTYKNIEVIVINDGSPDNGKTDQIAKSYGDRIRYFYKENGGVSSALNYGIRVMRGEWFSWLSHDDLYEPEKIEKQIDWVRKEKDPICVVRCTTKLIDATGKQIIRPQKQVSGQFSAAEMMRMHSLKEIGLYGCSLLIHKSILDRCGSFDETLRTVQDEDYWARIMFENYTFLSVPDVLVKIRVHEAQMTNVLEKEFEPERVLLSKKILQYYNNDPVLNREKLIIFICKQTKEQRLHIVRMMIKSLHQKGHLTQSEKTSIFAWGCYGYFYSNLKKLYRMVLVKSHI